MKLHFIVLNRRYFTLYIIYWNIEVVSKTSNFRLFLHIPRDFDLSTFLLFHLLYIQCKCSNCSWLSLYTFSTYSSSQVCSTEPKTHFRKRHSILFISEIENRTPVVQIERSVPFIHLEDFLRSGVGSYVVCLCRESISVHSILPLGEALWTQVAIGFLGKNLFQPAGKYHG